jgi:hypothetical protein
LGHDGADVEALAHQRAQRRDGEIGAAEEDDVH